MAQNPNNILAGPARVFVNVTVPATGNPPTFVPHTNGVPNNGGVEVGFTDGAVEFQYKTTKEEISPEQTYAPIDVYIKDEMSQLTFTCYELTYATVLRAFDNTGTLSDGTKDAFWFGNAASIISPFQLSVFFSSAQRRNSGKYTIGMLYHAYSVDGIKLPFTKTKPTVYQMTIKGLADVSRTQGDQMGQFYRETT